jgi:hypothetical protein
MRDCGAGKKRFRPFSEEKGTTARNNRCKKLLALRKSCDIFAPV